MAKLYDTLEDLIEKGLGKVEQERDTLAAQVKALEVQKRNLQSEVMMEEERTKKELQKIADAFEKESRRIPPEIETLRANLSHVQAQLASAEQMYAARLEKLSKAAADKYDELNQVTEALQARRNALEQVEKAAQVFKEAVKVL